MSPEERKRLLEILDYWHKIEYFTPFELDRRIDEHEEWQTRKLYRTDLHYSDDGSWATIDWPPGSEIHGFNLYLGVFDKSAVFQVCQQQWEFPPTELTLFQVLEQQVRAKLQGETCFARIQLDRNRIPLLDSVAVSTLPWAIGFAKTHGLKALEIDAFGKARGWLQEIFADFLAKRNKKGAGELGALEILQLYDLLVQWAEFNPGPQHPVALLEAIVKWPTLASIRRDSPDRLSDTVSMQEPETSEPPPEESETVAQSYSIKEIEQNTGPRIEILNSIYLRDIERIIASVRANRIPAGLHAYMTPLPPEQRLNLYSAETLQTLYDALHPQHMNPGRWFGSSKQPMALMQQFAINTTLNTSQGLYSINSPPGTGRTTLMREGIADVIVQRARVLGKLTRASDAFDMERKVDVSFKDDKQKYPINALIKELTGFEIVIVSEDSLSATKNMEELIDRSALDSYWRNAEYLRPVACNMTTEIDAGSVRPPTGERAPWGLICYHLEKSKQRKIFSERLIYSASRTLTQDAPLSLIDWAQCNHTMSFPQAAEEFNRLDATVEDAIAKRARLAELLEIFRTTTEEQHLAPYRAAIEQAHQQLADIDETVGSLKTQLSEAEHHYATLREEERSIERDRPGWWSRLIKNLAYEIYINAKRANARRQVEANLRCRALRDDLSGQIIEDREKACARVRTCDVELRKQQTLWRQWIAECQSLRELLGTPVLPTHLQQLEHETFQRSGVFHDEELAVLRSTLFAKALILHQAWLAEVCKPGGGFEVNIATLARMLDDDLPSDPEHHLLLWQSLFMIVPTVTLTLPAFVKQFRELRIGALGWLIVDGGERAVPQSVATAIWRAKRTVVIGDPHQTKPLFNLPLDLLAILGRFSTHTHIGIYAPDRVSSQTLADLANPHGAYRGAQDPIWIGSPLHIRRTSIEPMFGISNSIAYDNKLIYGLPTRILPDAPPVPIPSCWIDIPGTTHHEGVAEEQIRFVVDVILGIYSKLGQLPDLYVMSPFETVTQALKTALKEAAWQYDTAAQRWNRSELRTWLRTRVVTGMALRGNALDTVFVVLGGDHSQEGPAHWVASKPNLLNIALSHAKRRVYLIGDSSLWRTLPFFSQTLHGNHAMPVTTPAVFMAAMDY